jgi:alpha-glucosidase
VDGFKFDAGDPERYLQEDVRPFDGKSFDTEQSMLWARLGLEFPFNEFRACWRMGGEALVQRLGDKSYSWRAVASLVPDMIAAGLLGHIYTCPDMIGGGAAGTFRNDRNGGLDQELIVRSCQIHALMPMMQFSVAPWRVLDAEHLAICLEYARLHEELGPYLVEQAEKSAKTGEPIVRCMEYAFPGQGFETCTDQYMLGDRYLVAPMLGSGTSRTVRLPAGRWQDETGKTYRGGRTYTLDVPIDRVPRFTRKK